MADVTSDHRLAAGQFKNTIPARGRGLSRRQRKDLFAGLLFVAPAVLGFVLLKVVPILASFGIALTDWDIAGSPHWAGLENFRKMLVGDPLFWKSLWVTGFYTALSVPVSMAFAFGLASLLNKRIPGLGIFRTIFYLPSLIPVIATSILWLWMYNPDFGLFNAALGLVGIGKQKWIYSEWEVIPALVFMSMWSVGPMMIIFLAGLQDVPHQLYEAVDIDGGNAWHKLRYVTLPMMTPTILFNLLISMVASLQTFIQPFVMTEGGPNNGSLFFVYFIYRTAFQQSRMGYASALAWALFVVVGLLSLLVFRSSSRWVFYHGGND
jgi:multiple sugar transport system permease protein